jgi:ADP-ribosylglycohydrolase
MSPRATALDRARGALVGLAAADASSFPALYHRQLTMPRRRRLLWTQALDGDRTLVNKFPVPFTLSGDPSLMAFGPTDDTEQVVLAAEILLAAGDEPSLDRLFDEWVARVMPQADSFWGSVADRSAVLNAQEGLRAPVTGNDNPHHYDDSAVIRAVPAGILHAGDPQAAAALAGTFALITNAEVGAEGAAAFAAAIAVALEGGPSTEWFAVAREVIGESWISRNLEVAERILRDEGGVFAAVPRWSDEVVNAEYNFGNVVAETLPLALVIARESDSYAEALGVAALLPKQADTMPALVGALLGASTGYAGLPASWARPVERVRGICVPSTAGVVLEELAERLVARQVAPRRGVPHGA